MKVIIVMDQIQSGLGGKERADTPLGGQRIAMGSADNVAKALKKVKGEVIGTFYCGTDYYNANQELVQGKFARMATKMAADVVIVGPTYDYPEFAKMACEIGTAIATETAIPVIAAVALEKNAELIEAYKTKLPIVKMPKKGGTGLSGSIANLAQGCKVLTNQGDVERFKEQYCY